MAILSKAIYMFNAILINIPTTFCTEIEKITVKYIWKHKRPRAAKAIVNKMSNAGGITISGFKLYYRATTVKTAWFWHKNRQEDQWIRIEDPDINLCIYSQLMYKGAQNMMQKRQPLRQMLLGNWISTHRKLKPDPCLSSCTKINSK
jgi:hypothetical protein